MQCSIRSVTTKSYFIYLSMMPYSLFVFPNFNLYSTPLLVLVLQGLILGVMLLVRFIQKKNINDVLLASIVLITCYHRTTYTIGFMDWYDTFRNTKINYYLVSLGMVLAPLIYFYVKSITIADFKFKKKDFWHLVPWLLFFIIKLGVLLYDINQPNFDNVQNGPAVENLLWKYVDPLVTFFSTAQMLLYLAFTFQLFYNYRKKIQDFFSNTYKLELNWIRNFLYVYSFIFIYGILQIFIDEFIIELSWTQKWWLQFCSALIVIYVGVKGYFTDLIPLTSINFDVKSIKKSQKKKKESEEFKDKKHIVNQYFEAEKPYLNPDLNLSELANELQMNRAELSEVINSGFGQNFNDFINSFRVNLVKEKLAGGEHAKISLLGIALDSGFNSKATFNRVFKKLTNTSPTEFLQRMNN